MVTILSHTDKEAVTKVLAEAEKHTSAELVAVITEASDPYMGYVLSYGMLLGSALDVALWISQTITYFPALLAMQLMTMALLLWLKPLRHALLCLVPMRVLRHRAAHHAFGEYLRVAHHVSAGTPIALFYVSIAERYVHILPSREVKAKIANAEWEKIVGEFTNTLTSQNLKNASVSALEQIAKKLSEHFPA